MVGPFGEPLENYTKISEDLIRFDDDTIDWGPPSDGHRYYRVQAFCTFRQGVEEPSVHLEWYVWRVVKRTPKGVWVERDGERHLVLHGARKKWAYPDKDEALASFKIRLSWRGSYHATEGKRIGAINRLIKKMHGTS